MRFSLPAPPRAAAVVLLAVCCAWSLGAQAQRNGNGRAVKTVAGSTPYANREDAMRFADDVAERRGLDREWVRATIGSARFLPNVPRLMLPGPVGTVKNWQGLSQPLHRRDAHRRRRALLARQCRDARAG
jgi:membrane-bound lytic murein transglycosylase B